MCDFNEAEILRKRKTGLFDELPPGFHIPSDVTRSLHMHLEEGKLYGIGIPRSRLARMAVPKMVEDGLDSFSRFRKALLLQKEHGNVRSS
jgi:hypothetical protein